MAGLMDMDIKWFACICCKLTYIDILYDDNQTALLYGEYGWAFFILFFSLVSW